MPEWRGRRPWSQGEQHRHYNHHHHQQQQQQKQASPGNGTWQLCVPAWEKRFCTDVCSIPWKKLCETKRVMPLYQNVVRWDDSEAEEAFRNAKARFWAQINGLRCDSIPLVDPDKYIDKVDHDERLDPAMIEDLYDLPTPSPGGDDGDVIAWDSFLFADKPVPVSGWGD